MRAASLLAPGKAVKGSPSSRATKQEEQVSGDHGLMRTGQRFPVQDALSAVLSPLPMRNCFRPPEFQAPTRGRLAVHARDLLTPMKRLRTTMDLQQSVMKRHLPVCADEARFLGLRSGLLRRSISIRQQAAACARLSMSRVEGHLHEWATDHQKGRRSCFTS
mgnify:CR=1 FL=1